MAANLIKAGHEATVYNRTSSKAQKLVEEGARHAAQVADACQGDAVITMLADDTAVEASCSVVRVCSVACARAASTFPPAPSAWRSRRKWRRRTRQMASVSSQHRSLAGLTRRWRADFSSLSRVGP